VVLLDARGKGVPAVVTDDVEGGRLATRHLLALGHERIAFIGDDPDNPFGFTSSRDRERGYLEAMATGGADVRPDYICHGPHVRSVAQRLSEELLALQQPPTAIFAASDAQALGVLEAVRTTGLRVPDDISVVGFDDIEVSSYAGLTTVQQPLYQSGLEATSLLLEALDQGPLDPIEHELPLGLIVRNTTGAPTPQVVHSSHGGAGG
jgi:LacI family transcriptional regulator